MNKDSNKPDESVYTLRHVSFVVTPKGKSTCDEMATRVSVEDELAGEFVSIQQDGLSGHQRICLDPEEWPMVRSAIEMAIKSIGEAK